MKINEQQETRRFDKGMSGGNTVGSSSIWKKEKDSIDSCMPWKLNNSLWTRKFNSAVIKIIIIVDIDIDIIHTDIFVIVLQLFQNIDDFFL